MNALAAMGTAAGKLDCVTPHRDPVAAAALLDAAAAVAELINATAAYLASHETDEQTGDRWILRERIAAALAEVQS